MLVLSITPTIERGQNCRNKGAQYRREINKEHKGCRDGKDGGVVGGGRTREEESANSETFGGWAAAKSEIDCPAITIRCTQPGDGFRAEAMCFRVGVISVSAFFRIFQTDRTRLLFGWRPNRGSSDLTRGVLPNSPLHRRPCIIAARTMRITSQREWLYKGDDIFSRSSKMRPDNESFGETQNRVLVIPISGLRGVKEEMPTIYRKKGRTTE